MSPTVTMVAVFVAGVLASPFIFRGVFWTRARIARILLDSALNDQRPFGGMQPVYARASDQQRMKQNRRMEINARDEVYRALLRAVDAWDSVSWPWTSASKLR